MPEARQPLSPTPPPHTEQPVPPPGNGVTGLHQFRLDRLEKRVETLEQDVKTLLTDTAAIKATLAAMPTQANVYWLFAGALLVNFVTLVGHLLIRALSP